LHLPSGVYILIASPPFNHLSHIDDTTEVVVFL